MQLIKLLQLSALFSLANAIPIPDSEDGAAAIPAPDEAVPELPDLDSLSLEHQKRGDGSSSSSPKTLVLDMNSAAFDTYEADCMAILCFGAPITLKRDNPNHRSGHYTQSGASIKPFTDAEMTKRGVKRKHNDDISAEEYPYESATQGGKGALLVGVSRKAQGAQGRAMAGGYRTAGIDPGNWFTHRYINTSNSVYCKALMQNPPDRSVCNNKDPNAIVNLAYKKDKDRDGNKPFTFKHLISGKDKWSQI